MKPTILITFLLGALLAGCKKDSSKSNTGSSSNSYFPVSAGSAWQYSVNGGGTTDTLTIKVTGGATIISGQTYYNATSTYKHSGNSSSGYFFNINHIDGTLSPDPGLGFTLQMQMLNDTASAGYTWTSLPTSSGLVNGVPSQCVNKIIAKNLTKIVAGKTYSSVIHTQIDLQYNFGSGFQDTGLYDIYLAKGIGVIETDTQLFGSFTATEVLINYLVK